ncbi:MAG: DUF4271 domain-containing protein [Lewinellaceae bacterium]|nr:DUF4271 domain-containing protein [Lewinellaceae bacterium]
MRQQRFSWVLFFWAWAIGLTAQQAVLNPFDIVARLPENVRVSALSVADVPPGLAANPFNVVPHQIPGAAQGMSTRLSFEPLEVLPTGDMLSDSAVFWVLILLLAFLSFAITTKRSIVAKAWRGFLNDNALSIAQKEATGLIGSAPYYLLYSSFLLNAGMFIFLIARHFNPRTFNNIGFMLVCLLIAGVLFLSKYILLTILGSLYPVATEVRRYNFLILIFNCVLGLFLVPFNFLIAFARDFGDFMVFWTLALAGIFYLYRSVRATAIGSKFLSGNLFHFLLYLCVVEIAPH